MLRFFAATLAVFLSTAASAQDRYDSTELFRQGAWLVDVTYDTREDRFWCSAETTNNERQTFSITGYASRVATLFVFDRAWQLEERPVRFLVDIDRSRWTMDGQADDIGVSVRMNDTDAASRFIAQISRGNGVAVLNQDGDRIARFSLNGSRSAISSFFECWDRITNRDPFSGNNSDPFR